MYDGEDMVGEPDVEVVGFTPQRKYNVELNIYSNKSSEPICCLSVDHDDLSCLADLVSNFINAHAAVEAVQESLDSEALAEMEKAMMGTMEPAKPLSRQAVPLDELLDKLVPDRMPPAYFPPQPIYPPNAPFTKPGICYPPGTVLCNNLPDQLALTKNAGECGSAESDCSDCVGGCP